MLENQEVSEPVENWLDTEKTRGEIFDSFAIFNSLTEWDNILSYPKPLKIEIMNESVVHFYYSSLSMLFTFIDSA